ncbi:MAG: Cna B-type domain-containing protein, partial [Bacillota bacterium]|nr:Cna B-type domain-containing protein [Bacillota bacterium]
YKAGTKIVYTIEELTLGSGYTSVITGDAATGFEVTNTKTPEVVDVSGTKTWEDNNDQDGMRPESITIRLLKNGTEIASKEVTEADGWAWSFTDLSKYENGKPIVYTITEDPIAEYETVIDGYNVTNSYTPETVYVEGMKTWNDMDNQDGKRPAEITIHLWKTVGENESVLVKTITVTETDEWKWSFTDLPKYEGGQEITYTITEDPIDGYTTEVNGYDVTNTRIYTPPTGINLDFLPYVLLLAVAGVGIGATILRKRKNEA